MDSGPQENKSDNPFKFTQQEQEEAKKKKQEAKDKGKKKGKEDLYELLNVKKDATT